MYEPVRAFHEPERSHWLGYAASPVRPRRQHALAAEHADAIRRMVAGGVVPERETEHAYLRRVDGTLYVCPWQTRLRCLAAASGLAGAGAGAGGGGGGGSARVHIQSSGWQVPMPWFVPFGGDERWVSLGRPGIGERSVGQRPVGERPVDERPVDERAARTVGVRTADRCLVYTTPLSLARRRLARGLAAVRYLRDPAAPGCVVPIEADLAALSRWLERFHPGSLLELDYGGLVHLFSDEALCADESVAEVGAALHGIVRARREVAAAMLARVAGRWRTFHEFEQVN